MAIFVASDGCRIDFEGIGDGDPLLLVHGSATTRRCFDRVVSSLAERFTVIRYDRRGHGASGEGAEWSLRREVDDLTELAEDVGGRGGVCVLGYSFGGLIALEAVRASSTAIHALVAYEPPHAVESLTQSMPDVQTLLESGRLEDAVQLFLASTLLLSADVIDAMRHHPLWKVTLSALPNLRRELSAVMSAPVAAAEVPRPPVRVLVADRGGNAGFNEIAAALEVAVGSDTVHIPGLPHFAMSTEPEPFVSAVLEHLIRVHPTP